MIFTQSAYIHTMPFFFFFLVCQFIKISSQANRVKVGKVDFETEFSQLLSRYCKRGEISKELTTDLSVLREGLAQLEP